VLRSSGGETLIWSLFEASTDYFGGVDQQAMVNYRVRDLDAMLEQLRGAEIEIEGRTRTRTGASAGASIPRATASSSGSPRPGARPSC
jgi:hypothetical protein